MALRFTLQIEGEKQFDRALAGIEADFSDLRAEFSEVVKVLREHIKRQFAGEGAAGSSGQWKRLSEPYRTNKERRFPNALILELSGAMRDSLITANTNTVLEMKPQEFAFGTRKPYAKFHQRGTPKMPRRPIIDLTETDKTAIVKAIQKTLARRTRARGFETKET